MSWHVIVLEGPEATIRGFIAGVVTGAALDPEELFLADEVTVAYESLAERLRELLPSHARHVIVASPRVVPLVLGALQADEVPGVSCCRHEPVAAASFEFEAETPSREAADRVHDVLLATLPPGVTRLDAEEVGEFDPTVHGIELRDPQHQFTYRAKGRITGEFPGIVTVHRAAKDLDFVSVTPLRVQHPT